MADDTTILAALLETFRQQLAVGDITLANIKAYRATALTALLAGTTIIQLTFEGGSSGATVNGNPALILAACNQALAESADLVGATGTIHLDLSLNRIEA